MKATMVRNQQPGPTVFGDDSTGLKPVVWQGTGDPNGGDVKPVPDPLFESVQFQSALAYGIFSVVEDPAEQRRIQESKRQQFQEAEQQRQNISTAVLDTPEDNDILMKECIGPSGNSGKLCGETVQIRANKVNDAPPLCQKHGYLKSQFVPQETDRIVGGKPEVVWVRMTVGSPEKKQG